VSALGRQHCDGYSSPLLSLRLHCCLRRRRHRRRLHCFHCHRRRRHRLRCCCRIPTAVIAVAVTVTVKVSIAVCVEVSIAVLSLSPSRSTLQPPYYNNQPNTLLPTSSKWLIIHQLLLFESLLQHPFSFLLPLLLPCVYSFVSVATLPSHSRCCYSRSCRKRFCSICCCCPIRCPSSSDSALAKVYK
jgi:hypothetical protein